MTANLVSTANRVVYFSISSREAAKRLSKHLIKSPNDSLILPYVDHPGPVSNELLSRKFKSMIVCERNPELRMHFQSYCKSKYPDRNIRVYSDDLFDLSFKTHSDEAQNRCAEIVSESLNAATVSSSEGSDGQVKFLVPLLKSRHEVGFLRNLYYQMCLKLGLCSNTLIHYYFLMSERQHMYLVAKPKQDMRLYRSSTVLFNTIFNIRTLDSFELRDSFGISLRKIQNTAANNSDSYKQVYLTWLEPRLDILSTLDPKSLVEFRFLVTQMMQKRKCLVYPFIGKFFAGFERDLTNLGIYGTTRSGDLDRDQYYKLYLYLSSRKDYRTSTFLHATASAETLYSITSLDSV